MKVLGPKRIEMIQQKDAEIEKEDKNIQEDQRIADDENEEPVVRERAREKAQESREKKNELVNEREQLRKGLSIRERIEYLGERIKEIFKKYGTVTAI